MSYATGAGKPTFVRLPAAAGAFFRVSFPLLPMASFSTPSRDTLIITAFMASLVALGALFLGLR